MWNWRHNGGKILNKFTYKFKVFVYANEISPFNAYRMLYGGNCELLLFIVFEICGTVCLYILFVTVCEQYGDGWVECLRHVTAEYRSNWQIIVVHMIFCLIITLFQNNMLTCSSDSKFSNLGMGNSYIRETGEGGWSQSVGVLSRTVELLGW
jgi:hypothetical protein